MPASATAGSRFLCPSEPSTCGRLTLDDFCAGPVRRIVAAQDVPGPLARLPGGNRALALRLRDEARAVHEPVLVEVARAVREDLCGLDAGHGLSLRGLREQRIGLQ